MHIGPISEHDGCKTLQLGDSVSVTPLCSCCLIVMRMASGTIYAEHCGGTNLDNLSSVFFSEPVDEAIMVSSRESTYQIGQANALQLKDNLSGTKLYYYASNEDNYPAPYVTVNQDGSFNLESINNYHLVTY